MKHGAAAWIPIAASLAAMASPAAASRPGEEGLRLLAPHEIGGEVAPGWILEGVETHEEFVRFSFSSKAATGPGCDATFEVTARDTAHPGLAPLERYSLFLARSSCGQDPGALVESVSSLVSSNEAAGPSLAPPRGEPVVPASGVAIDDHAKPLLHSQVLCLFLLLAGLLLAGMSLERREVRLGLLSPDPPTASAAAWLLPVIPLLLAAAARFLDSPHTIANANAHAYNWIRTAIYGIGEVDYWPYGNGYPSFFNAIFLCGLPRSGEAVMAINALLGALSVLPLYALSMALFRNRWGALASALVWALLPAHVRMSTSEDFPALLSFSQILAAFAAVMAGRFPSITSLGAVAFLTLFSVQVRPEGWMMAPCAAILFASSAGRAGMKKIVKRPEAWIVLAVTIMGAWGPAAHLVGRLSLGSGAHHSIQPLSAHTWEILLLGPFASSEGIGNATLNPLVTSPAVVILAAAAAVAYRRSGAPAVAALASCYLLFALGVVGIQQGIIATLRLQASYQWTVAVLAGAGFAWAAGRLLENGSRRIAVAIVALAAVCYLPYRPFIHRLYATQMEYAFLKEALPAIPDGCTVVRLDRSVDRIDTDLPTWIASEAGKRLRFVEVSDFLDRTDAAEEGCLVFYRGLTCFSFSPGTKGPAEQPLCARMDELRGADVASRVIPPERADHIVYRVKEIPLAFTRIPPKADPGGKE